LLVVFGGGPAPLGCGNLALKARRGKTSEISKQYIYTYVCVCVCVCKYIHICVYVYVYATTTRLSARGRSTMHRIHTQEGAVGRLTRPLTHSLTHSPPPSFPRKTKYVVYPNKIKWMDEYRWGVPWPIATRSCCPPPQSRSSGRSASSRFVCGFIRIYMCIYMCECMCV
jgi:hypothetical protein